MVPGAVVENHCLWWTKNERKEREKDKQTNRETHFECITVDGVDGSVCRSVLCVESSLFV